MLVPAIVSAAVLSITVLLAASAAASEVPRRVIIEFENLTSGQLLSSGPFVAHRQGLHLWQEGKEADLLIRQLAEEGNSDYVAGTAVTDGGRYYGDVAISIPALPGQKRRVELSVTETYSHVSGAFMLSATNDGFAGVDAVDAFTLHRMVTFDVFALDAGTSRNIETKAYLRVHNGFRREAEGGVVTRHLGLQGGSDVPEFWKFNPSKPVARFTIIPITSAATDHR
jgi:hypothetical protein